MDSRHWSSTFAARPAIATPSFPSRRCRLVVANHDATRDECRRGGHRPLIDATELVAAFVRISRECRDTRTGRSLS